jgi:Cof subfamily protein (haloacid dehalogenase superfamily)
MYKAIVSDLDGTLLNSKHRISDRTRNTVRRLVDRGICFVLATGRHLINVRSFRDTLGVRCDLITANGAVVSDPDDRLVFHAVLPVEIASDLVLGIALQFPEVDVNVFDRSGWHVGRELPEYLESHKNSTFLYQISYLPSLVEGGIYKMFFSGKHEALLVLRDYLASVYSDEIGVVFSRDDCLEVMPKGVHKGNAVIRALDAHDIDPIEAIAFGDGMNDFEMLTMVGQGVVMENATACLHGALPSLPRAASCDDDGVALYLERVFGSTV